VQSPTLTHDNETGVIEPLSGTENPRVAGALQGPEPSAACWIVKIRGMALPDGGKNEPTASGPDEAELRALGLTPSQARVLRRIAMGASTDGVAHELGIAPRTVHKHLERIYSRLGVSDRAGAAAQAWATSGPAPPAPLVQASHGPPYQRKTRQ
jgi:DNA-binding CsgD family transcriptional regulator